MIFRGLFTLILSFIANSTPSKPCYFRPVEIPMSEYLKEIEENERGYNEFKSKNPKDFFK